jgi:hypothetical protein
METPSASKPAPYFTDTYVFDWRAQTFRADLIFILPLAICLAISLAAGHPGAGLIATGGAFTVGFGSKQNIENSHLLPMILASLGISAATFVGMVAGHTNFTLVAIAAAGGFLYGMLSLRHAAVGWVGQQSVIFLLVASAFPFSPKAAAIRSSLVMAGGAIQILTSSILLKLLPQLRRDLINVGPFIREQHDALRSSVEEAARHLIVKRTFTDAVPYALRLAVTLGVSTEIYRHFGFPSGYWIPMTALIVLRPGLSDTVNRAVARTLGTFTGAIVASHVLAYLRPSDGVLVVLVLLFAWLAYSLNNVNYSLFTFCLTAYIVSLLSLATLPSAEVAHRRALCTIIGGSLALTVRLLVISYRQTHPVMPKEASPGTGTTGR